MGTTLSANLLPNSFHHTTNSSFIMSHSRIKLQEANTPDSQITINSPDFILPLSSPMQSKCIQSNQILGKQLNTKATVNPKSVTNLILEPARTQTLTANTGISAKDVTNLAMPEKIVPHSQDEIYGLQPKIFVITFGKTLPYYCQRCWVVRNSTTTPSSFFKRNFESYCIENHYW